MGMYAPNTIRKTGVKVTDFVIQEIDVATGDVLFEWHALDHVPLSASYVGSSERRMVLGLLPRELGCEPPPEGGNTLVVSARKTSAIYGINSITGRVRWTLGGKQDEFAW